MKLTNSPFFAFIFVFFMGSSHANTLVQWSEQASDQFAVNSCLTIPGTAGVPQQCAPSVDVKYPCPAWNKPGRLCSHKVGGPCSPAIPGVPATKHCASKNFGSFGIKVDGGVFTSIDGLSSSEIDVKNTVSVALFGKHLVIPMSCRVAAGTKTTVCLNMLSGTFTKNNTSGVSCEVGGVDFGSLSYPGVTANVCTDFDFNVVNNKPVGSVAVRVESDVAFGSASVAGKTLSFGNKSWNPRVLKVPLQ